MVYDKKNYKNFFRKYSILDGSNPRKVRTFFPSTVFLNKDSDCLLFLNDMLLNLSKKIKFIVIAIIFFRILAYFEHCEINIRND